MNQRTHPIVDPVLAVLAILMVLALVMYGTGCAAPQAAAARNGHPTINEYSLVRFNFAPRIQAKIGGSDTEVFVTNENNGGSGTIEKETPIHATQNTPTEVKGTVTP